MKIVVLMKQVPMVAELPWDRKTGQLRREAAEGMMNPACKHALEAALRLKDQHGAEITALSMGPATAEEVLREALALGADRAVLVSDSRLAGADTLATSYTLAWAVAMVAAEFDLMLLGCASTDSETGQVPPQMAEELDLPFAADAEEIELDHGLLRVRRVSDGFMETLELSLPAVVSVTTHGPKPRPVPMYGVEQAFDSGEVLVLDADDMAVDPSQVGWAGSAGAILQVYSPTADKQGQVLRGAPKRCVIQLLQEHGDRLGGILGKDLGGES